MLVGRYNRLPRLMIPRRGHSAALHDPLALGTGATVAGRRDAHAWAVDSRRSIVTVVTAHLRLARPADNLFAAIGTLLGAGLAGVPLEPVVFAMAISNALLSSASMIFNDWHDVAEDSVNRPDRPIPSGAVRRSDAWVLSMLLFSAGILTAGSSGWSFGLAAITVTTVSILYTCRWKAVPILGNGTVGLLSSYPLWCWLLVTREPHLVYAGAAAAFFIGGAGREIVRTSADAPGDAALGIRTLATRYGGTLANRAGLALILAGLLCAWLSSAAAGPGYLAALSIATVVLLAACLHSFGCASAIRVSARITALARTMTAVLAGGVLWDLVASGWLRP
jgi:geranylgeranylglycerol-phosphate geranylgeranyltransferase